ncbi:tenascin-N isoform X1 [Etheostoma cragini]|uniref:tenascin-N isoform X1 n=1 Tax=Etheostoma cragini TaxID=417921 RepID=UPI00155EBADE|nr:tenascin-N isoform X1 [Etheostoma cragini]XP_034743901.1 tenascin-N isoform X1 [Etheostoma cragini]XP_034743902.1 tenascin-N isoform X1 [Etheostoma cragini]
MTTRLLWRALCPLVLICTVSPFGSATNHPDPSAPEQGVTFSHVYKIDIPGSSSCKLERLPTQDETGLQTETTTNGENDIIFRHNIRLLTPTCDCAESESFKSLLYRVNGLEEEVNYLKTQCTQGCCGSGGAAGVDKSCSGYGTYQPDTCSCLCNPGWEGPDCSVSSCPDECNDNGRCVDGKCVCHQGYTGEDCSQLMCPDNCNDKGQCVDGKCVCFPHFTGEDCSVQKCPNDCIGNGQCVDGQCICEEGFFGEDCSLVLGPQGLRLVQLTDVSLLVEWDSVRGAEYYILTYHPKDDKGALEQVQVPNTESSYLITGLTPGVTYIVQVYAVIKEIQSEADTIEATTDVSAIDGIRVLGQTEISIQVDWKNPSAEVDLFRLKHTDPAGQEEALNVQRSQEARTKHTIVGLFPGTEYQISVQAIKGTTEGKPSSVTGATDIDAPNNLVTTEVTEDTATVSWDRVQAEIEGYMLSYTSAEGSSTDIPVGRDSTLYRLVGLKPGVLHTVYIWAFKGDKVSSKSSTEAETELDAPTNILARDETESSFRVSWDPTQAEIDGYTLTYSSSQGSSEEIPVGSDSTSYMLTGLRPGVPYTVYIWAIKGSKVSRKISTKAETDLDAPANLLARDMTETSFSVSWDPAQAEIDGYLVTYSSSEGYSGEIPVGPDSTSLMLTSLRPGVLYTVYIWAIKGNKASRKISTQAQTELDAPANLLAQDETETTFSLSWDPVQAEIDGYILTYSSSEGFSEEIPVGSDSRSYMLTGLRPGVLYTVYIWAIKGSKGSRKISTKAETDIDAPKDLKATDVTLDSAFLTWVPPLADIEGYSLSYRDEDGNMEMVEKRLGASENSFAVASLETGKRYIVTIIAYTENKRSKVVETVFRTVGLMYPFPMDCVQIMKNGNKKSAIYTVYINNDRSKPIEVYCDMETDGGGWLVLQRRTVGKLDFMKRWKQYIIGFGNMTDEFWIGLDKIYELTNTPTQYELRFDLGLGAERAFAVYDNFKIAPVKQKFQLTIGKYSGTAGDAMTYHQGRPWTTIDNDNDIALGNCALTHRGAWWYKNCHLANPNGKWGDNRHSLGVNWEPWKGHLVSLDFTEMKIRPVGALYSRKRRSLMAREKSRTTNLQKK